MRISMVYVAFGTLLATVGNTAFAQPQLATLSVAAYPSLTADTLAQALRDPSSNFTVTSNTATFAINASVPAPMTDHRAVGVFINGMVPPGTTLADQADLNAVFAGGIGIPYGICLTTGFLSDDEPTRPAQFSTVGVEGTNDGMPIDLLDSGGSPIPDHEGEVSKNLQGAGRFDDKDFLAAVPGILPGGDPAVLQFGVDLSSPGFLRVSFVFGSDEYPWWSADFNDTFAILIKGPCTPADSPGDNLATFVTSGITSNFSLLKLQGCAPLFLKNQMSPSALLSHPNSRHQIVDPLNYRTYYDHEFAGFSKVLTRETAKPLSPGHYTVKFVIEDVRDTQVDSALFVPTSSVKLYSLNPGDYNGNGVVDAADYVVWRHHQNQSPAGFYDGDGNGDCVVNNDDYSVWRAHFGEIGNADYAADFNRDGCVDQLDYAILQQYSGILSNCASRFEGDANGDGAVDSQDQAIWQSESGSCSGGNSPHFAARTTANGAKTLSLADIPASPDVNGDGTVDEKDLAALDQIILGTDIAHYAGPGERPSIVVKQAPQPEPTLAEPVHILHNR